MKKISLASLLILIALLASCNKNKEPNTIKEDVGMVDNSKTLVKESLDLNKPELYCEIELESTKQQASNYELKSFNALKKGAITTTFSISLNEDMYNRNPLEIELIMIRESNSPKLITGTYPIKSLMESEKGLVRYFDFVGNVISMETYKNAIAVDLLEDIEEDFVFLSEGTNKLIIESVEGINIEEEENGVYESGKQLLTGSLQVSLLKVSNKEKIQLKVDFRVNHDWILVNMDNKK
ncbi:hypothetical protein [Flavivirga algicola]|uniref:Lipoprotein n=1 Tax=Flavivirga algicola TaxID=2729136 RepID=A0ABX1RWK1_9FLAO|nr:hypothetical protein [Flavivirga algicola]NMH87942.1 hypothetical protein [Flavivirga algicola]